MSDRMQPLSFQQILAWILNEYRYRNSIFGIQQESLFYSQANSKYTVFDETIDTPVGPAAGPHTQMAPNIIAAYLTGGRFIELKTVQIMDRLEIPKPCIDAEDECYNVEWSQELTLEQSYDEYLKAWLLLHVLQFLLFNQHSRGFVFNMSVGYDLKGIKSERMDRFIEKLRGNEILSDFDTYRSQLTDPTFLQSLKEIFPDHFEQNTYIKFIASIPAKISGSVTLSTMHGCPPEEIESIAAYLLQSKQLHTHVKLNPTLLGYQQVSRILDRTGFKQVRMSEESFSHDLKMQEAVPMIQRLENTARRQKLEFGVKLSNTLGIRNHKKALQGDEMYMSGRSLFPLTIHLADLLAQKFDGDLNISFSGGATAANVAEILDCGIFPVTLVTDLLKPGGYLRLKEIAHFATQIPSRENGIDLKKLRQLADTSLQNPVYRRSYRLPGNIKSARKLPLIDCFMAPCVEACPIHQDVPQYIELIGQQKYDEALRLIMDKNPLPNITGYICDHQCQFHCTRIDYEQPLQIRDLKKLAAESASAGGLQELFSPQTQSSAKAAIIGAGPSGLAAAFFLKRVGLKVTVFDKRESAGGVVRHAIPPFRLPQSAIEKDIEFIESLGVEFVFGYDEAQPVASLQKKGFKYIYLAVGAEKSRDSIAAAAEWPVLNAIEFLRKYRKGENLQPGKRVAVIGGGNSAMDGARAAKRCTGVEKVDIIYRRTAEQMPADREEFEAALKDGIGFHELLLPLEFDKGKLRCQRMQLGEQGEDGRRNVTAVEGRFEIFETDTVISAIGEMVDLELLAANGLKFNSKGWPHSDPDSNESSLQNVFIGGDALRGPATVVEAIADGKKAAETIIRREGLQLIPAYQPDKSDPLKISGITARKGEIRETESDLLTETSRCLQCDTVCTKCVDVCPNRANVAVAAPGGEFTDRFQILHLDGLCNECGNCATFCPYDGAPYKDKLTFFNSESDMKNSSNEGFYIAGRNDNRIRVFLRLKSLSGLFEFDKTSGTFSSNRRPARETEPYLHILKAFLEEGWI